MKQYTWAKETDRRGSIMKKKAEINGYGGRRGEGKRV